MRHYLFHLRVAVALLAVVAITASATWAIRAAATSRFKATRAGQLVEQLQHVAPQIEKHGQELDELSRP